MPAEAMDMAAEMVREFGDRALLVARDRLRARMEDGLPRRIDLYSAVCAILVEQRRTRPRWIRSPLAWCRSVRRNSLKA